MEDCCTAAEEDWETAGICGEATVVDAFRIETLGCAGVVDTDTKGTLGGKKHECTEQRN